MENNGTRNDANNTIERGSFKACIAVYNGVPQANSFMCSSTCKNLG